MISFLTFVQQNPAGKSVATPEGTWLGQCVSLIRQRLAQVEGYNIGAMGDAVDYASSTNQKRLSSIGFTWKEGDTSFQDGDILVWGDDPGTWTGPAGHIAMWYQGQMYNQNYGNTLKISFNKFFSQGYLGRYTKEVKKVLTPEEITVIYRDASVGDLPPADHIKAWVGRPYGEYLTYVDQDPSLRARQAQAKAAMENVNKKFVPFTKQLFEEVKE